MLGGVISVMMTAVLAVTPSLTPVNGYGGFWEEAYTSTPSACDVALDELLAHSVAFDCDSGNLDRADDNDNFLSVQVSDGTNAKLVVNYDDSTGNFQAVVSGSPGSSEVGKYRAGLVPVCFDRSSVKKRGNSVFFDASGTINDIQLQWDGCYQNMTPGIELFAYALSNQAGSNNDPGAVFNGNIPYQYYTYTAFNGDTPEFTDDDVKYWGVRWLDPFGEWSIKKKYNTLAYQVIFVSDAASFKADWDDPWYMANIAGRCHFFKSGDNSYYYGEAGSTSGTTLNKVADAYKTSCFQGNLTRYTAHYLPGETINPSLTGTEFEMIPRLRSTDHIGTPHFSADWNLFNAVWGGNPNGMNGLPNGFPSSSTDDRSYFCATGFMDSDHPDNQPVLNSYRGKIGLCVGTFTPNDSWAFGDYLYIQSPFWGNPYATDVCPTHNFPGQSLANCQLGYAHIGINGGRKTESSLMVSVLKQVDGTGAIPIDPGPPLTGLDPNPSDTDPATQTYLVYNYSTGETINTGVCVHSECVWNNWYSQTVIFNNPFQGIDWSPENSNLLGDFFGALPALVQSILDFLSDLIDKIIGLVIPDIDMAGFLALFKAFIDNNAIILNLHDLFDGLNEIFGPYLGGA